MSLIYLNVQLLIDPPPSPPHRVEVLAVNTAGRGDAATITIMTQSLGKCCVRIALYKSTTMLMLAQCMCDSAFALCKSSSLQNVICPQFSQVVTFFNLQVNTHVCLFDMYMHGPKRWLVPTTTTDQCGHITDIIAMLLC